MDDNVDGWIKINGRNPNPCTPLNQPVLVVCAAFFTADVDVMAWTGTGWSCMAPWVVTHKDGDDVFYWRELPEPPTKNARELWSGKHDDAE